ncbi:Heat shock factor (HSF)-type DNA-binding [Penicillium robsamsonii]|uniref:Heat shock factor (HSF)-type DNA-binding n=1 Tax=Penicillium robsamsonii TaxID=1792511 RepID=UPI002546E696|nr:Heat shock factor (HSF)-type DNA-binding [Penicillium robsamsonii]KAJ5824292.1 Heat shock factor (HSF)-type DNA-binding [Penicillium robsamsonii]
MSRLADPPSTRISFAGLPDAPGRTRNIPVLSSSGQHSMDITPPPTGAQGEDRMVGITNGEAGSNALNAPNPAIGAAAAAQQPKVVQTAFIHKLYNMLEDPSIQHLISWSGTNDSFVMSPTSEFSKVLASYFKHTNISSFVRQLNMYGFHKVSDVFHTGSPDSALWEFKHGNGNFKRGDLAGLREIKRRASRHALIHRDSFPGHKAPASQPGTPAEPAPDATDARFLNIESSLYEMHGRLVRAEEGNIVLNSRCHAMTESLTKCYQWTHSISRFLQAVVPDRESPLHRDVSSMQREVEKHIEIMRAIETPHETLMPPRQQYLASMAEAGPPLSPRQMPQDDARRQSMMDHTPRPTNMIRPPVPPPSLSIPSPLRLDWRRQFCLDIRSPPASRCAAPTATDIRQHGWSPSAGSPYPPGNPPNGPWPSSPGHQTPVSSDQQVRDVLAQYEMGAPRRLQEQSRHATPPTAEPSPSMLGVDNGWTLGGSRFPHGSSLPATRRSSMASNVHSLLNPADTAERPDEDQQAMAEDRKRKRLE